MTPPLTRDERRAASRPLAAELGMVHEQGDVFPVYSRSRYPHQYEMTILPEGIAVHLGEGCEAEQYRGQLACPHSKEYSVTNQAVVPYEARALEKIEFSPEQIQVLKNTICRGASDAELQLFTYACSSIGLNPFLKQIWAIIRNVNVGTRDAPKYEKQLTIQVGIDGYRVIRDRIRDVNGVPLFEGMDGPQWSDDGTNWLDYPFSARPKFARVAVWRRGIPRPFPAVARMEAYDQGNSMWKQMGPEQLAKCAEALSLRRAFPAEMSALPSGPVAEYEGPVLSDPTPRAALVEPEPQDESPPPAIEGEVIDATPEGEVVQRDMQSLAADVQLSRIAALLSEARDTLKTGYAAFFGELRAAFPAAVEGDSLMPTRLTKEEATAFILHCEVAIDRVKAATKAEKQAALPT